MSYKYEINKALTKKVLVIGCEKLYLKFVATPFLIAAVVLFPMNLMNLAVGLALLFNFMIFVLIGQFLARKNPYFVEMALRHLGYYKFYYAQKKYGTTQKGFFFNLVANDSKGTVRTFKNVNRFN